MTVAFVLANCRHGSMIVNRFDYNEGFNGGFYGVGAQILENGEFDGREVATVKELLKIRREHFGDGVVAIDCGANIGVHSVEWANLMQGWGSVVAIEAQERVFYALTGNLALQNCFNARAIWAAVADGEGTISIPEPNYAVPSSFGSFELKNRLGVENIGQPIDYDNPTLRVRTLTLDSLKLERVDLIKLDIEGMELEALAGGVETIKRCKPILVVECIKVDRDQLGGLLDELGYIQHPMGINTLAVHKSDPSLSHLKIEKKAA